MKRVCIIGHFGHGENLLNGQTVKTKIVTKEIVKELGKKEVSCIDTHGGVKALISAFRQALIALKYHKNIIIMPAENGLRIFAPLLVLLNLLFHRKLHYVVIGGWLPEFLKKRKKLTRALMSFDGIYVETNTMRKALEAQGFNNVYVMPNFKDLNILKESELVYHHTEPYRLCTFSRVMKEKGIEDAVNAVKTVNEQAGRKVYTLDIYGQIDDAQTEWFEKLKLNFPEYVNYRGVVSFDQSVDVLKEYFALLFPTGFFTEGIPGTIIDAYAAGIPVISAEWESFSDVVDKDVTGVGYTFGNFEELCFVLKNIASNPQIIQEMKKACIEKAKEFTPEVAIEILVGGGNLFNVRTIRHLFVLSPIPCNGDFPELKPLPLCTFSRVMKEKGIEDAVNAVKTVNEHFGRTVYTLDIYGQVDSAQMEWFNELKSTFSSYIKYGELVPFDKSVEVLKNYFALLFPTYYEGEGFAGTLLDAMAAGVPVIASDWRYNPEIVNEKTGYVYPVHDNHAFVTTLISVGNNPDLLLSKKSDCLKEAEKYRAENVIQCLTSKL